MMTNYSKISDYNTNRICSLFEYSRDINYIKTMVPEFEYNMIISVLTSAGQYNDIIKDYMCQLTIKDKKVIFISDTHYGSRYDNIILPHRVFNFATCYGIKTIFHCGDILHGNPSNNKGRIDDFEQLKCFLENYPRDKEIKTHALLGNHDYLAISHKGRIYYDLNSRDDIEILGSKKAFVDWHGFNIGLQHNIEKYKLFFPGEFHEDYNFRGHSHYYFIKEYEGQYHIHVPALCDDPTYLLSRKNEIEDKKIFRPGFLTAEKYDDCIVITNYYFDENNYIVRDSERPLVKKYKNTSI